MVDYDHPGWQITRRWIEQQFHIESQRHHPAAKVDDPYGMKDKKTGMPMLMSQFDDFFTAKTTIWRYRSDIEGIVEVHEYINNNMTAELVIEETGILDGANRVSRKPRVEQMIDTIHMLFEDEDAQSFAQGIYESELANYIVPFFALVQAAADEYAVDILNEKVIDEEYKGSNNTISYLRDELRQPSREKLLQRTATIDDSLRTDMRDVRKRRNDLVHSFRSSDFFELAEDSTDMIERAVSMLDRLDNHSSFGDSIG